MNNPNPLVPQGSLPLRSRGKSTIRIAVLTIVAIHAVFFAGLLMQGCKRDDATKGGSTNRSTDLGGQPSDLAKLNTNYYEELPQTPLPLNTTTSALTNAGTGYPTATPLTPLVTPPPLPETQPALPSPTETKEYTIVRNDTLAKIAKSQHTTVGEITKANPGLDPKKLIPGKKIQVPVSSRMAANGAGAGGLGFAEPSKPESAGGSKEVIHQVKAGETLTKIAKQHGTTVKALRAANGLKTDRVLVGQKLKVPASSTSSAGASAPSEPVLVPSSPTTTLSATNPAGNTTVR